MIINTAKAKVITNPAEEFLKKEILNFYFSSSFLLLLLLLMLTWLFLLCWQREKKQLSLSVGRLPDVALFLLLLMIVAFSGPPHSFLSRVLWRHKMYCSRTLTRKHQIQPLCSLPLFLFWKSPMEKTVRRENGEGKRERVVLALPSCCVENGAKAVWFRSLICPVGHRTGPTRLQPRCAATTSGFNVTRGSLIDSSLNIHFARYP